MNSSWSSAISGPRRPAPAPSSSSWSGRRSKKKRRSYSRELLAAVEAAAAAIADDPADRLFAEDTARGLKLVQLLSRRYDVAVMNPPYGAFVPRVRDFVKAAYPLTSNDIYAAFIDRACQLTEREGYVGALVSSTFTNLKSFERLRTEILLKRNPLILMLDLGFGDSRRRDRGSRPPSRSREERREPVAAAVALGRTGFRLSLPCGVRPDPGRALPGSSTRRLLRIPAEPAQAVQSPGGRTRQAGEGPTAAPRRAQSLGGLRPGWDWITGPNGILLNYAGCLDPRRDPDRREDEGVARATSS